jgi:hypothetical protein
MAPTASFLVLGTPILLASFTTLALTLLLAKFI